MTGTQKIPGFDPAHPAQRLSDEARQRIANAREEGELMMNRAIAAVHTRWASEYGPAPSELRAPADLSKLLTAKPWKSFEDFCAKEGAVELANAKMEATRIELAVIRNELTAVTSGSELWNVIQNEVAAACHALQLTGPQKNVIWGELRRGLVLGTPSPSLKKAAAKVGRPKEEQGLNAETIEKLKAAKQTMTLRSIAKHSRVHADTVQKSLNGESVAKKQREKLVKFLETLQK